VVEVTGVRISEDAKQKVKADFVVVNHSPAELPPLGLQVTLRASTAKPDDEPIAVVDVTTSSIEANGSANVSAPLKTKLRAYELPDWQFLRATFEVTSPK
jgi:hypothetical protein